MAIRQTWRNAGEKCFSVIIGGDVCPREENSQFVAENAASIVKEMKGVFEKDAFKILQWECAVTGGGEPIVKSGPNLRCTENVLNLLSELSIDAALLANNHTGDYGPSEVLTTIDAIEKRGILTVGAGRNFDDAAKPLIVEKNGVRMAILNFCENEFGGVRKDIPGTNCLDPFLNIEQIKAARKQADVVIVTIHGGHEFYPYPSVRMVRTYRAFAEAGADAVWNCHTHCPCGFEVWQGKPIIYSPGNFYFPGRGESVSSWWTGYVTKFLCDENGVYGYELTPYGFCMEKMFPLAGEQLAQAERYLLGIASVIGDFDRLQSLFESWCTGAGIGYMSVVNNTRSEDYPPDWSDPEVVRKWIPARNLFNCESHADLLRHTTRLYEEGRMAEAAAGLAEIQKLWEPEFVTWLD